MYLRWNSHGDVISFLARRREQKDRIKIDSSRCRDLRPTVFYPRPRYDATISAVKENGTKHLRLRFPDALPRTICLDRQNAASCYSVLVLQGPTYPSHIRYNASTKNISLCLNARSFYVPTLRIFLVFSDGKCHTG